MHPVIVSRVTSQEDNLKLNSLDQILKSEAPGTFGTRFSVVSTFPEKPESLVRVLNTKTEVLREVGGAFLKKDEKYVIAAVFLAEDYSLATTNQLARIHIIDRGDNKGVTSTLFKGVKFEDLMKKKDTQAKVAHCLKVIQKFNVWIEGKVALNKQGLLELVDTELKQY
jgi:ribosome biogenesis SPOUT family RNA methylase Rps3